MRAREREESAERTEEKKLKGMKNAVSGISVPRAVSASGFQ